MWRNKHPALALSALLFLAAPAIANDFAVGGSGADLVPLDETRVQMQSEQIAMLLNDDDFEVTADYVFANDGAEPVTMQVGFPEILCPGDVDCVAKFTNLKTLVDGAAVEHRQGKLKRKHAWAKHLGTVWLFDVTFAPKSSTKIRHTYNVTTGGNVDQYRSFDYVTRTGATWAGKIARAEFTLKLPPEAHIVSTGMGKPTLVEPKDGEPYVELRLEHTDWEPQTDIHLDFQLSALMAPDLGPDRLKRSGLNPEHECPSVHSPKSAEQLQMCKNLIYALSGHKFARPELSKYFYGGPHGWRLAPLPTFDSEPSSEKVWVRGLQELPGHDSSKMPALNQQFLQHLNEVGAKEFSPPAAIAASSQDTTAAPARSAGAAPAPPSQSDPSAPKPESSARSSSTAETTPTAISPEQRTSGCALGIHPCQRSSALAWAAALALALVRRKRRSLSCSGRVIAQA
jgi:hypothetical protein